MASSRSKGSRSAPADSFEPKLLENSEMNSSDVTATEVLGNIDAMQHGIESIQAGDAISVELLLTNPRAAASRIAA